MATTNPSLTNPADNRKCLKSVLLAIDFELNLLRQACLPEENEDGDAGHNGNGNDDGYAPEEIIPLDKVDIQQIFKNSEVQKEKDKEKEISSPPPTEQTKKVPPTPAPRVRTNTNASSPPPTNSLPPTPQSNYLPPTPQTHTALTTTPPKPTTLPPVPPPRENKKPVHAYANKPLPTPPGVTKKLVYEAPATSNTTFPPYSTDSPRNSITSVNSAFSWTSSSSATSTSSASTLGNTSPLDAADISLRKVSVLIYPKEILAIDQERNKKREQALLARKISVRTKLKQIHDSELGKKSENLTEEERRKGLIIDEEQFLPDNDDEEGFGGLEAEDSIGEEQKKLQLGSLEAIIEKQAEMQRQREMRLSQGKIQNSSTTDEKELGAGERKKSLNQAKMEEKAVEIAAAPTGSVSMPTTNAVSVAPSGSGCNLTGGKKKRSWGWIGKRTSEILSI